MIGVMRCDDAAGAENHCESGSHRVGVDLTSPAPCGLNPLKCGSHGQGYPEISSKFGWGGARPNSGGARPNSGGARPGAGRKPRGELAEERIRAGIASIRVPVVTGERWYCLQAYRGMDLIALESVLRLGFPGLVVRFERELPDRRRVLRPLFPGFLFGRFDRDFDDWRPLATAPGVRRLFGATPERPTPLPFGVVERIIWQMRDDGVAREEPLPEPEPIEIDAEYRVMAGPLEDLRGICRWAEGDRVRLWQTILGREIPIELPRSVVERV